MKIEIKPYTEERIGDVVLFEKRLREEEDVWGWEIDEEYISKVKQSFSDPMFADSISLLAYSGDKVVGRIDSSMIRSRSRDIRSMRTRYTDTSIHSPASSIWNIR